MIQMIKEVKPRLKIRGYRLFYADKKAGKDEDIIYGKLLTSEKHGLTGKPDFVFKRGRKLVPVELKSGKLNGLGHPHRGDLMQLTAYFVILHDLFGLKPRQGRLIYADTMFVVKNKWRLRRDLFKTIGEMRRTLANEGPENPPERDYMKCRFCLCRETVCETAHDSQ